MRGHKFRYISFIKIEYVTYIITRLRYFILD